MRTKVTDVLFIMILILLLCLIFGSYGLYSWSVTLDGSIAYHLFYTPLKKFNDINMLWGGTIFVEEGRDVWDGWIASPQKKIDHEDQISENAEDKIPEFVQKHIDEETDLPIPAQLFKGETLDFLVIGDSLANSIGKQLGPLMNTYSDMTCRVEGVISSNLIRLDYYDWLTEGPRIAREAPYDCIFIFLGANTMQSFFLEGQRVLLFSDEWISIYKERACTLLDSLDQDETRVYWMTLPPMQKDTYNKNIKRLNGIIDEICLEKGIERLSYQSLITDNQGEYISEKVVADKQILLRSDGIHFTREGADYISHFLIDQMRLIYKLPKESEILEQDQIKEEIQP
jgi:hypothetical protein